ncbi:hypothetical protein FBULB1_7524 [Fusarium bulbicola]|nr:hypothetical protein FBULB1_7524 [Fusarium bulbicola]
MIGNISGIIKDQSGLEDFQFPPPTISSVAFLAPPKPDGLKCRKCPYIVKHVKKIMAHCHSCQHWNNPQRRGRPRQADSELEVELPWIEGVLCQRFFPSRRGSRWFEVGRKTAAHACMGKQGKTPVGGSSAQSQLNPEMRAHLREVLEREQQYLDAKTQPRFYSKALGDDSFAATSLWLERTRWPITYKNVRRDILQAMTRLPIRAKAGSVETDYFLGQGPLDGDPDIIIPRKDEEKIMCFLSAVDAMLDRCELTAENTSRVLLCWLASSRLNIFQAKPFALKVEQNTRKRYRLLWKRFIAFTLRAYLLPDIIREHEVKINLNARLKSQIKHLWEHQAWENIDTMRPIWPSPQRLDQSPGIPQRYNNKDIEINTPGRFESPNGNDTNSISGEESSDDYESSEQEDGNFEVSEREDSLDDWAYDMDSRNVPDVSSFCRDAGHRFMDRMAVENAKEFLELLFELSLSITMESFADGQPGSALLVYFSGILGFSSDCRRFQLAREYCPVLSGLIWVQRLLFLEYALPLHSYPTIGIHQRPQFPMQRLNEVRQKYMVQGSLSPLAELHNLRNFGQKVAKTEPPPFLLRWSDDGKVVSYGSDFSLSMEEFRGLADHFIAQAENLCDELMFGFEPNLDVNKIKDDFTNSQPGFSFVSHPDNMFDTMYQELLVQACTSCGVRLARNGHWSFRVVAWYLQKVATLEENISGGLLTACGQSPRIRDLLSLAVENSPCAIRGIFVWNGSVAYALHHHKAKRSTNQEFHVVRFLPARLSVVVVKYLVCIRRLAALLRREQSGLTNQMAPYEQRHLLFQHNGKPWAPMRITRVIRAASKEVWNRGINARVYRQLAIGITEKHVREVHSPFNRYDDTSSDADLNVTFAWQSGHRPLQRGITYGLDGAYPHQLQPSLLRAYQWASTKWHEFLHQASQYASSSDTVSLLVPSRRMCLNNAQATRPMMMITKQPEIVAANKRKTVSDGDTSRSIKTTLGSSPSVRTHAAVRIDGLAAILPEYPILICLICKTAVRPGKGIESHYRNTHFLKGEMLKAVNALHSEWALQDPLYMSPRDKESRVIPDLKVKHGFSCKVCIYLTISKDNFVKHCSKNHAELKTSTEKQYEEVSLQTWLGGKYVQYWTVLDC